MFTPFQKLTHNDFDTANIVCIDNWQIKINKEDHVKITEDYFVITKDSTEILVNKSQIIKITMK